MYAVYKQTHPPTGLEFSLYCHFFSAAERNLVVAGTSQLFVYRLNHEPEVSSPKMNPKTLKKKNPKINPKKMIPWKKRSQNNPQ
uniref:Uncharacterized protein n=1 Tax=Serinus canaria TaxID=9135 RepID=A0A8C9L0G9_SERCA